MDDLRAGIDRGGHCQVDTKRLQRRVRITEECWNRRCQRIGAFATEAMHSDVREIAEVRDEVLDMDAGTAVDFRGPFLGEHLYVHGTKA